eukprot:SAG31_NODE_13185_length_887_cov_0.913706_1_plen_136_part_00
MMQELTASGTLGKIKAKEQKAEKSFQYKIDTTLMRAAEAQLNFIAKQAAIQCKRRQNERQIEIQAQAVEAKGVRAQSVLDVSIHSRAIALQFLSHSDFIACRPRSSCATSGSSRQCLQSLSERSLEPTQKSLVAR